MSKAVSKDKYIVCFQINTHTEENRLKIHNKYDQEQGEQKYTIKGSKEGDNEHQQQTEQQQGEVEMECGWLFYYYY